MKKYFFYLIFLILFTSVTTAINNPNLTLYYSFDDSTLNGSNQYLDVVNNYAAFYNLTGATTGASGVLGEAVMFDGNKDSIEIPDTDLLTVRSIDFSYCLWVNTSITDNQLYFQWDDDSIHRRMSMNQRADDSRINVNLRTGIPNVCTPRFDVTVNNGEFHHLCFISNTTICADFSLIVDGVRQDIFSFENTLDVTDITYDISNNARFGYRSDGILDLEGQIDEFCYFNKALDMSEVLNLYNSGLGNECLNVSPPITEFESMSLVTSLINNTINYNLESLNFTFNGTVENTNNIFNVTIKIDDVTEYELNSIDITDNTLINISLISFEGIINISVNASNNNVSNTTGYFYYNIDTVNPEIDLCNGLFVDGGIYITNEILTWCINFTDSNLFAYEINVTDKTNNIWNNQQYFGENITTSTAINITSYTLTTKGNFSIITRVWDSHTTKVISDYKWKKLSGVNYKGISFSNNKFNMTTNTYSNIENWHLLKTKDRYMLNITFNDKQLNQNFDIYIGTNKQINYLPFSKYQGHFIIGRKHWLDWETKSNISNFTIKYISSIDQWRVRFKPQENNIVFKSIGNLNTFSRTYTYEVLAEIDLEVQALNNISINIFRGIKMLSLIIVLIINWLLYIFLLNKVDENKDHLKYVNSVIFMILIVAFNTINESMFSLLSVLGVTVSFFNLFD